MSLTIAVIFVILFVLYIYRTYLSEDKVHDMPKPSFRAIDDHNSEQRVAKGFPNAWYLAIASHELTTNQVMPITICNEELVLFRGVTGRVYCLSAYCPHMGSNIGIGGKALHIDGRDCISCPFHGWTFDGLSGKCVKIPNINSSDIPERAAIATWPILEQDQVIYLWYDSNGRKPSYSPTNIGHKYGLDFELYKKTKAMHVFNNIQYIWENAFDLEHFKYIHDVIIPRVLILDITSKLMDSVDNSHTIEQEFRIKLFGAHLATLHHSMTLNAPPIIESIFTLHLPFTSVTFITLFTSIPIAPLKTEFYCSLFIRKTLFSRLISRFVVLWYYEVNIQDRPNWANLMPPIHPVLTTNDRSIVEGKRWARSFYTKQ